MKITNNTQNLNFQGRYKILLSTDEFKKFESNVLPILDKQHNNYVDYFYGKTPADIIFDQALEEYAKSSGASKEWAFKNLEKHGIKFQNGDNSILYITTGEKDCNLLSKIDKKLDSRYDVRKIVNLFKIFKKDKGIDADLLDILAADKSMNDLSKTFYKFTLKYPFRKVKSLDEVVFDNPHKLYGD